MPGLVFNKHDVGGSESFAQSYATVHGSLTSENGYMVDGMEVALPRGTGGFVAGYWDAFMFDEVNYQVANAPAERSRGGILYNMITRTGSNNFTGQAQLIGTGNRLQSNNISPALRTQLLKQVRPQVLAANPDIEPSAEILDLYDFSARASGPIIEDKLWYATAVKRMILNQIRLGSYDPDGSPVLGRQPDAEFLDQALVGRWPVTASFTTCSTSTRRPPFTTPATREPAFARAPRRGSRTTRTSSTR